MIRQRFIDLVDDLAGIRIFHHFRVSVVPAVLSLLPVHPLLAGVRPTKLRLRASANRLGLALRSSLPAVENPSFSNESPYDDDHLREGHPEGDDPLPTLGTPHQLLMSVMPRVRAFDGLIAKDKFCMSRYARLSLSHSRLRPKPTGSQTNRAASHLASSIRAFYLQNAPFYSGGTRIRTGRSP